MLPELRERLDRAGCFRRTPLRQIAGGAFDLGASIALHLCASRSPWWLAVPLFVLACFFNTRLGWLMHDAAHNAVFDDVRPNRVLAYVVGCLGGQFSSGWRWGHNQHHGATNVRGVDSDKKERWDESMVFGSQLAASMLFFFVKFKGAWLPRFDLLLALRDGVYCHRHARGVFRAELAGVVLCRLAFLAFFVFAYGPWGAALYFVSSFLMMTYLNAVFAGNHYDLESFSEEEAARIPFVELQVRTTRNYAGGAFTHYLCGGLEHQIEHHLFPRLPRTRLMRAGAVVRAFCAERGLPYQELSFWESLGRVATFHTASARRLAAPAE